MRSIFFRDPRAKKKNPRKKICVEMSSSSSSIYVQSHERLQTLPLMTRRVGVKHISYVAIDMGNLRFPSLMDAASPVHGRLRRRQVCICCTTVPVYSLSRPFSLCQDLRYPYIEISTFHFVPNKRTFDIENFPVNYTEVPLFV